MKNKSVTFLTQAAMIAAIYVVLTMIFAPFSFGEVQVRVAEALTILPIFTPAAIPGLFVGCLIGNITGGAVLPDIIFGSKISAFSFFQTNSLGAEVLYSKAREYVGETKDKVVFDLYSGTGTIAQMLAAVAKKVIGVEIVEEAVEAAKQNAALNGLENCEFIAGDVLKVIDEIEEKPDLIVLDPPRDGIHPKALEKIIDFGGTWTASHASVN